MTRGNYSLGVLLDIEQSFDIVSLKATKERLLKGPPSISEGIYHMVRNVFITVSPCGESIIEKATKESSQGVETGTFSRHSLGI